MDKVSVKDKIVTEILKKKEKKTMIEKIVHDF